MRVGPFEIRRSVQAAEAAPRAKGEIGASGTVLLDGFLQQSEYNAELRGLNGVQKFRRMIDSDGSVQEALEHLYAPIRNATWTVEPPENPDDDELTAVSLVESALFEWPTQPWLEHLDGALEYLAYGHAVFEPAWQVVEKELRVPVLGEFETVGPMKQRVQKYRTLPPRQYLTLKRFAPRLQETLYRWHAEDGDLISIEQQALEERRLRHVDDPRRRPARADAQASRRRVHRQEHPSRRPQGVGDEGADREDPDDRDGTPRRRPADRLPARVDEGRRRRARPARVDPAERPCRRVQLHRCPGHEG
jgi:hypothetical protein